MTAKKPVAKTNADLKKSGAEKLAKAGKTTSTAHISFGVRHGKITKQEAAALDPKNFKYLLQEHKPVSSKTITLRGGGVGGMFNTKNR